MPTYDYKCDTCDKVVEIFHGINDESEQLCENCKAPMHVVIGAPGVVFKGEGWATVDKRGKGTDIYL
jgi:putative FmdB family regulatory protein